MIPFLPTNWYWIVGGDLTQVYSSASGTFVPSADPSFVAWKAAGGIPTKIDTAANLGGVIANVNALRPVDASVLDGYQNFQVSALDKVQFKIMFAQQNQIRALNSQPPLTVPQFMAVVKALL